MTDRPASEPEERRAEEPAVVQELASYMLGFSAGMARLPEHERTNEAALRSARIFLGAHWNALKKSAETGGSELADRIERLVKAGYTTELQGLREAEEENRRLRSELAEAKREVAEERTKAEHARTVVRRIGARGGIWADESAAILEVMNEVQPAKEPAGKP